MKASIWQENEKPISFGSHRLCVAPMMDWTDRHCRYFHRLLSRYTLLYTEMITTGAILHGDRERLLAYHPHEQPLALQLGGSDPGELAQSAQIAESAGFSEVNLNVGCPSDRVRSGRFGACLMAEPELVAACIQAMHTAVSIPVTLKTRIGIDDRDSYEELRYFIECSAAAGCRTFIIHARKAWLNGLSPKENREIPPLHYDTIYRLKRELPDLTIIINGGITDLDQATLHLAYVDGAMIGRAAYQNPYLLAHADPLLFSAAAVPMSRYSVVEAILPYMESQLAQGVRLAAMTRHILGLFQGRPGARAWRRYLSENAHKPGAGIAVLKTALEKVRTTELAQLPQATPSPAAIV